MSCRHPRRGATEILLAGSSVPCHPVVAVAESYTNSTSWGVPGCWSQCPGSCHLRRMKNPIPGRRVWGSHLRLLLEPQALWRLTHHAGLQRLHRRSLSHLGASLLATTPERLHSGWNSLAGQQERTLRSEMKPLIPTEACDVSAFVPGIARMAENVMDRDMKIAFRDRNTSTLQ